MVVRFNVFLSSANLICRGAVSESPLDFEITRVDCSSGSKKGECLLIRAQLFKANDVVS